MPRPHPTDAGDLTARFAPPSTPVAVPRPRPGEAGRPSPRPRPTPRPRHPVEDPAPAADSPLTRFAAPGAPRHAAAPRPTDRDPAEDHLDSDEDVELPAEPEGEEQIAVWALVADAQAGRAEAFGELYDRYADMVFRYLYHRVSDRQTAEDFTSETFVRALRRIDSLTFQGRDVGAWLVTIARNIVRDHVKSSRFRLEVSTADMRDADRATDGPEDAVLQGLTNDQLLACVAQLNDEQRECIVLRFLQGLSVAETAAAMGKKDGAVKALQHRAVKRLGNLLPEGLR